MKLRMQKRLPVFRSIQDEHDTFQRQIRQRNDKKEFKKIIHIVYSGYYMQTQGMMTKVGERVVFTT